MDTVNARILAKRDTTANWNANRQFRPMRGEVIIYTDHGKMKDDFGNEIDVPGIKIGDGNAYLVDLPFVGDDVRFQILRELREHTSNTVIHVTQQDRDFWNNKLNCQVVEGNLIFNRM